MDNKMTTFTKWGEQELRKYLKKDSFPEPLDFIRGLDNGNIVAVIKNVAKSGMSCEVRFYRMSAINEHVYLTDMSGFIARAGGFEMSHDIYGYEKNVILRECGSNVVYACLEHVYNRIKEYTDLTDKSFSEVYKGYSLL